MSERGSEQERVLRAQLDNAHDALVKIEAYARDRIGDDRIVRLAQDGLFTEVCTFGLANGGKESSMAPTPSDPGELESELAAAREAVDYMAGLVVYIAESVGHEDARGNCQQCGNGSVAHYCPPLEEARKQLRELATATLDRLSPTSPEDSDGRD